MSDLGRAAARMAVMHNRAAGDYDPSDPTGKEHGKAYVAWAAVVILADVAKLDASSAIRKARRITERLLRQHAYPDYEIVEAWGDAKKFFPK